MRRRLLIVILLAVASAQLPSPVTAEAAGAWPPLQATAARPGGSFAYSDLLAAMQRHQVRRAVLDPGHGTATVWLSDGREEKLGIDPRSDLAERLAAAGARVEVRQATQRRWPALLLFCLALAGVVGAAFLRLRRRPGDAAPGVPHAAAATPAQRPDVRFADVAGCDEAVEEMREFVTFLRDPRRFTRVGARMPSGLLLHGPPGTGKTLLAKALAGEAGVPFLAAAGSDFMDRYVGVGAARVRQLFARARSSEQGAVVFIDELDAIGKLRSDPADGGNGERDHTLNQLLVELDGFESRRRIVCVAATNRMELLDPALLRPGRLSRHVLVDLPSAAGRRAILDVHARGKPFATDVDLDRLADGTAGRSGADLADLLNEGAIMAARSGRGMISHADLEEGHLRVLAGPAKRTSPLSADEREVVAHHEAGHALVAEVCPSQDKTLRLTIRPRGRAAGLAVTASRDRTLHSTQHVHEQLMVLLGGRAAERAVYGHVSSGAANDLQQANALARRAVTEFGFSPRAGQLVAGLGGRPLRLADTTHRVIDEEVERMIAEAYGHALSLIEDHRAELDRLAAALLASEELDRLEIAAVLGRPRPVRRVRPAPGPRTHPALVSPEPSPPPAPGRALRPRLASALAAFTGRPGRDRDAPAS